MINNSAAIINPGIRPGMKNGGYSILFYGPLTREEKSPRFLFIYHFVIKFLNCSVMRL